MSEEAVDKLFDSLYKLTDLREIFRKTSPTHELDSDQEEEMKEILEEVRKNLDYIEEEILE